MAFSRMIWKTKYADLVTGVHVKIRNPQTTMNTGVHVKIRNPQTTMNTGVHVRIRNPQVTLKHGSTRKHQERIKE